MKKGTGIDMLGLYFSGTGNSRYALEVFLKKYQREAQSFTIEDENAISQVKENQEIIFSYSVQYSNIPKMLYDFVTAASIYAQDRRLLY